MKLPHNIEYLGFQADGGPEYVGHSAGIWHIRHIGESLWEAKPICIRTLNEKTLYARSLKELSELLQARLDVPRETTEHSTKP